MESRINFETLIVLERGALRAFSNRIHIIWNSFNLGIVLVTVEWVALTPSIHKIHNIHICVCACVVILALYLLCDQAWISGPLAYITQILGLWDWATTPGFLWCWEPNPGLPLWKAREGLYSWATCPALLGVFLLFSSWNDFPCPEKYLGLCAGSLSMSWKFNKIENYIRPKGKISSVSMMVVYWI